MQFVPNSSNDGTTTASIFPGHSNGASFLFIFFGWFFVALTITQCCYFLSYARKRLNKRRLRPRRRDFHEALADARKMTSSRSANTSPSAVHPTSRLPRAIPSRRCDPRGLRPAPPDEERVRAVLRRFRDVRRRRRFLVDRRREGHARGIRLVALGEEAARRRRGRRAPDGQVLL